MTVSGQLTAGGIAYPTSDGSADQVLKTDGSGALSFGTVSGTTLNNNTNNYVMTGTGSSNTLNGESGLTYDGSTLNITGKVHIGNTFTADGSYDNLVVGTGSGNEGITIYGAANGASSIAFADPNDSDVGNIMYDHSSNFMKFVTNAGERMRIDSSGRVGINRTPAISSSKLEVGGADNVPLINVEASGTTGGIGVGGSKVQIFHGTSAKLFLTSDGKLGVNESVPTGKIHVRDNNFSGYMGVFSQGGTGGANHGMYIETASSSSYLMIQKVSGTTHHYVAGNGNYYFSGTAQSDLNKKENIADISNGLDVVNNLRPRTFNFKENSTVDKAGFIAQEAQIVEPKLVTGNEFDETQTDEEGSNPTGLGFDYMGYTAYLTKAIQEQQTIIDDLKSRIETLEE